LELTQTQKWVIHSTFAYQNNLQLSMHTSHAFWVNLKREANMPLLSISLFGWLVAGSWC
jgi:hypothetical protein